MKKLLIMLLLVGTVFSDTDSLRVSRQIEAIDKDMKSAGIKIKKSIGYSLGSSLCFVLSAMTLTKEESSLSITLSLTGIVCGVLSINSIWEAGNELSKERAK